MKNWMKEEQIHLDPQKKMQFLLLLAVCAGEALLIAVEGMFHSLGYHVVKHYIFIPCFMFLGTLLGRRMTDAARQNLWLSVLAAVWFVLAQFRHRKLDLEYINGGMFFLSYLMALPFASALEDQEKNIGMKLASTLFLLASLGLVAYSGLLVLEWQPEYMQKYVYWDGTRLHCLWHPNVTACVFMIGISICLSYMFHTKKSWKRLLLTIVVCLQFGIMALTNCSYFTIRAGGRTGVTILFDSVYSWVVFVPVAMLLSHKTALGLVSMFALVQGLEGIKAVIGLWLVKKGIWVRNIVSNV